MNGLIKGITAVVATLALLAVEAFFAMFTYTAIQLYSLNLFGYLVGLSRVVLTTFLSWLTWILPGMNNQIEATLGGELSPKAMLLLLIGLVVGAFIRFLIWSVGRMLGAQR